MFLKKSCLYLIDPHIIIIYITKRNETENDQLFENVQPEEIYLSEYMGILSTRKR